MKPNIVTNTLLAILIVCCLILGLMLVRDSKERADQAEFIGVVFGTNAEQTRKHFEQTLARMDASDSRDEAQRIQSEQIRRGHFEVIVAKLEAIENQLKRNGPFIPIPNPFPPAPSPRPVPAPNPGDEPIGQVGQQAGVN